MITTSDNYVLTEGSKVLYSGLRILSVPTVSDLLGTVEIEARALFDTDSIANHVSLSFTEAEINAFTSSGTTDRDKFYNQCEQAVKDYLEGLTENSGATFTIT